MNNFSSEVKQKLDSIIQDMSDHHWLFTQNPGRDFSRQHLGKLSFADTIRMTIGMGKGSTDDEIHPDNPEKYIITADRGYESYDNIFLCELKN